MRHALPAGFSAALPLGAGGQARTFLCWQDDPGRWVVLKTDPRDRGELEAESDVLERLPGAPVPALLAKDLAGKRPWIATSLVDGIRLDRLPDDLDQDDLRTILAAAARSLGALHNRGVVHGDLSPSNLLALPAGEVVLVDLGMASIGGTRPGGTWETFSPERIQGRPASPASDVFALGVLALRLLLRIPESTTRTREAWSRAVLDGALPALAPDLPVVARATGIDPALRPTASEFATAIAAGRGDWPRERLRRKADADFEALLRDGIARAERHKAWNDAWRLQRERIERSADPEPLLPDLGRFARARSTRSLALRDHRVLVVVIAALLGLAVLASSLLTSDSRARPSAPSAAPPRGPLEPTGVPTASIVAFPLPPVPPGASLRVDGLPTDMPDDGVLPLNMGRHRIQIRDAVGALLLDTFWLALPPSGRTGPDTRMEDPR